MTTSEQQVHAQPGEAAAAVRPGQAPSPIGSASSAATRSRQSEHGGAQPSPTAEPARPARVPVEVATASRISGADAPEQDGSGVPADLSEAADDVLDSLRQLGRATVQALEEETGCDRHQVVRALGHLSGAGLARVEDGAWLPGAAPGSAPSGPRGGPDSTRERVLRMVRERPGLTTMEIANEIERGKTRVCQIGALLGLRSARSWERCAGNRGPSLVVRWYPPDSAPEAPQPEEVVDAVDGQSGEVDVARARGDAAVVGPDAGAVGRDGGDRDDGPGEPEPEAAPGARPAGLNASLVLEHLECQRALFDARTEIARLRGELGEVEARADERAAELEEIYRAAGVLDRAERLRCGLVVARLERP